MIKNFFTRYAKTIFEWFGISCSIIGLVVTLITQYSNKVNETNTDLVNSFKWSFGGLAILLFGVLCISIVFAYRNGKLMDERRVYQSGLEKLDELESNQKLIALMVHNVAHESRDILNKFNDTTLLIDEEYRKGEGLDRLSLEDIREFLSIIENEYSQYATNLLNSTKKIFDVLTQDETAVTIKIFNTPIGDVLDLKGVTVNTFKRDSVSKISRRHIDQVMPLYTVSKNTAFREIIQSNDRSYYYCNDLINNKDYENSNSNWSKKYNACLVSALSTVADPETKDYTVIGAICVDNFKGNFDDALTHNVLASISDVYASVMYEYEGLDYLLQLKKETFKTEEDEG